MPASTFYKPTTTSGSAAARPEVQEIWSRYDKLDRTQWSSPAEIEQLQLREIRALLEHCQRHVPYYSRQLQAAGLIPRDIQTLEDFRRLPITSRQTWQEHAADLQATQLPAGMHLTAQSRTSGTTGIPLQVLQTNVVHQWWWACQFRDLEWSHIDPRGDLAAIRSPKGTLSAPHLRQYQLGISMPSWFPESPGLAETGSSHVMDVRQSPQKQLAWLRRVSPNYLLSYPSNLEVLAGLIWESGQKLPRLQAIQTISETLRPEARARIEAAFGVPVKSIYSCAEAGYVASPCPDEHGLHVHAEHVLLEVLNADGQPCAPGETGRVVLTALHNYLNPFIRYEIQDEVTLAVAPCPCGRGLPLLTTVQGKARPSFQLGGGRTKSSNEMIFGLYDTGGYRQHQVIQRSLEHVLVRIVPNDGWTVEHPRRLTDVVHKFFERPIGVEVQLVDRIEPAASGKIYDMICEIPVSHVSATASSQTAVPDAPRVGSAKGQTVLFAWELGNGMGHIQQLLPLARVLAGHGLKAVFAVRNLDQSGTMLRDLGFEVLQSPVYKPEAPSAPGFVASYSDILGRHGFDAVPHLEPQVQAWQTLLDQVHPSLIVCDHSPTLCLTAYGAIPTIVVGNGFCVPPTQGPTFPKLIPANPLEYPEAQLLQTIQEVQHARGRQAPATLPGLFAQSERFVTALPEIDPYDGFRTEPVIGPLERLDPPCGPPETPSYFAYLDAAVPGVGAILAGLAQSGIPGQAYLRNLPPSQRDSLIRPGLEILHRPPPLTEVLPRVSAIVHHASGGTSQHALAIGRPQLVFPSQLEQVINAQMIHKLGVGNYILKIVQPEVIAQEFRHLISESGFADRAWARACELQERSSCNGLSQVLARCFGLLNNSSVPHFSKD
ncbi:MAG: hypothetical protein JWN70_1559 [Planctomycetaceae bacterium]|nr:hypothetical protein [Planctomycetaceae bacterium]